MIHVEYPTTDIVLAAALKMHGAKFERIHIRNGKQGVFFFSNVEQGFLDSFNTGQVLVEPCAFHAEIKSLTMAVNRIRGVR